MESIISRAMLSAQRSKIAFSKYITANDVGSTGGHQAGYHIHKDSWALIFDKPGVKGENKDKFVTIKWQGDFETQSRFIYYGVGTRNEYRLTRFGRGFPFLDDSNVGDLLVICWIEKDYYEAFVLLSDDEIDEFFAAMNISSINTNGIIPKQFQQLPEDILIQCFMGFINSLKTDFPSTIDLANSSRKCYNSAYNLDTKQIKQDPDLSILGWLDAEFQLFKTIENDRYNYRIQTPFKSVEELVETANTILNRRKSRAGKSLEHHLAEIFKTFDLKFVTQATTEDNKKPDFLFPSAQAYFSKDYNPNKLVVLASKTTCKDRWRQILNEADKVKIKHLFTLQQGISRNQLEEMYKCNVCLVVPRPYLSSFPRDFREKILTLDNFVFHVQQIQE